MKKIRAGIDMTRFRRNEQVHGSFGDTNRALNTFIDAVCPQWNRGVQHIGVATFILSEHDYTIFKMILGNIITEYKL